MYGGEFESSVAENKQRKHGQGNREKQREEVEGSQGCDYTSDETRSVFRERHDLQLLKQSPYQAAGSKQLRLLVCTSYDCKIGNGPAD